MSKEHINAIIRTQTHLSGDIIQLFKEELKYRDF